MADHHDQDHPHDHSHDAADNHDYAHSHAHDNGFLATLREGIPFLHGHSHGELNLDNALETSERGISALKVSLAILAITALIQIGIYAISGSAGLLADTIHNFSDALTAIPLGLAFLLTRRAANRRYTYGYGRAAELSGSRIVLILFGGEMLAGVVCA